MLSMHELSMHAHMYMYYLDRIRCLESCKTSHRGNAELIRIKFQLTKIFTFFMEM